MAVDGSVERLRRLLSIPTISRLDVRETDWPRFDEFTATVESLYPLIHSRLRRELVNGHCLVYRWPGRSADDASVLMAHHDVVAVTGQGWEHPPFAAELTGDGDERLLWGRGALDNKAALAAILEAVEGRLAAGYTPAHDVYLVSTHDEETAGGAAAAVAALLESRGVRPRLVLDEGGAIVSGVLPGVARPLAMVGVSEKGYTAVRLVVEQQGGHAATPPRLSAPVRLARAIVRIDDRPFPPRFDATALMMFRTAGRHASGLFGFVYRNLWLTRPLLLAAFRRMSDETGAVTRTTRVVTMLQGSDAPNAMAERATAIVNLRILAGSSVTAAIAHLRRAIADEGVRLEVLHSSEPSPVSPATGPAWEAITASLAQTHPGTVPMPYVTNGATDSRHFTRICRAVYRFTPFEMTRAERGTMHARNERIHVETFQRGIRFYDALLGRL